MRHFSLTLCCGIWLCLNVQAQKGNLYLKNYDFAVRPLAIASLPEGIMCFSTTEGVVVYDGQRTELYTLPTTLYRMLYDSLNQCLWAGGRAAVGQIKLNKQGEIYFQRLWSVVGDVEQLQLQQDTLWAQTANAIYAFHAPSQRLLHRYLPPAGYRFNGLFLHQANAYASVPGKGIYWLRPRSMESITTPVPLQSTGIKASIQFDKQRSLIGDYNSQLWLFDGNRFVRYRSPASRYLQTFLLKDIHRLRNDHRIMFSTISGGCMLVDWQSGIVTDLINYETGLADNETSSCFEDQQGGLWIGHGSGVSRVALHAPIRMYSYPGLDSSPTCLKIMGRDLYVGTNSGLFVLSKVQNEQVVSRRIYEEPKRWIKATTTTIIVEKERNPYADALKAYIMQSAPYYYKKVENIESKCKQLINYKGKLIVATNTGLYEVTQQKGFSILSNLHIQAIASLPNKNMLYAATEKGIFAIREYKGYWKVIDHYQVAINVNNMAIHQHTLWVGHRNGILALYVRKDGQFARIKHFELCGSAVEPIWIHQASKQQLYFTSQKGILTYSPLLGGMLLPHPQINQQLHPQAQLTVYPSGHVWFRQQHQWFHLKQQSVQALSPSVLHYFGKIKDFTTDHEGNLWILSNDWILKIPQNKTYNSPSTRILVRHVQDESGHLVPLTNPQYIHIPSNSNGIKLSLAFPYYLADQSTYFQYKLVDESNAQWSAWRHTPEIEFAYLPSGKHRLALRVSSGQEHKQETIITLDVEPPFYETGWFYTLEILILLGMLWLSIQLNKKYRQARFTSVLTIVSIITIVEFIVIMLEPYVDDFSGGVPVFKLIANVILAYYLLPIERRVRKMIQKGWSVPETSPYTPNRRITPLQLPTQQTRQGAFVAGHEPHQNHERRTNASIHDKKEKS